MESQTDKPTTLIVKSGQQFTDLMNRQKAGELYVHSLEFVSNAKYVVKVSYAKQILQPS